jgi:gliding motility-associated-like protein
MYKSVKTAKPVLLYCVILLMATKLYSQTCTTLGQTPSTAFPVCGTTTFTQSTVPLCATTNIFVPGCTGTGNANYQNRNPFWYKFTCFTSGTLSFTITPLLANEDYDWQLFDITGHNPDDVFTDPSLVIAGNWSGSYGTTGASSSGVTGIECASDPAANTPRFARSPNLIAGHEYILMVSHFTDGQSGYNLSFGGGTAVITDPALPHLQKVTPDCDGKTFTVKLNKKMRCSSLTAPGTEFSISPAASTVVSAVAANCSSAFDFDELTVTLSAPLPNGNYQLIIRNGSDNNTILDFCDRNIPVDEQLSFTYAAPQPLLADSIGRIGCAPSKLIVYFPKKIKCSSVAADGSDFTITGPTPVTISGATGNCVNDLSDVVIVNLSAPISTQGNYLLNLKPGTDGTIIIDMCGLQTPLQSLPFSTSDTVNADFSFINDMGCRFDTLHFFHNGNNDVNSWSWVLNNKTRFATQDIIAVLPATSSNTIKLFVSNGVCSDSTSMTIDLNNEVKADFTMPDEICPEDKLIVTNTSQGLIDNWLWKFDVTGTSTLKDPQPVRFNPPFNTEILYTISLTAVNTALGCTDTRVKQLKVLKNCFIAVPTGFTPNNDGLNDYFYPNNALKADNLDFKVFNRWGQMVFHSRNWKDKWDGKINGLEQPTGVYVWMLSYTHHDTGEKVFQKGTVVLIR